MCGCTPGKKCPHREGYLSESRANPDPSRPEIPMPDGPALLYVWSDGLTASVVDQGGIPEGAHGRGPRERAILRALLTVALDALDAAEVSR